jgi:restriction system protein
MTRKNSASLADDIAKLVSLLPWWLGVTLAIAGYFVLHTFAVESAVAQSAELGQVGNIALAAMGRTLAQVGQYLLPLLFLVGAAISFLKARRNVQLVGKATGANAAQAISGLSWREFELLIAEGFRRRGFNVKDMGGKGPDGGVDLALSQGGEHFLVQCKQWRASKVGVAVVRELFGVMSAEGATGGYVVTCGSFTQDATDFAKGRNIHLLSGHELVELLESGKRTLPTSNAAMPAESSPKLLPVCPKCGAEMKVREAKKGASAGSKFLGCSTYPTCRGTLPL